MTADGLLAIAVLADVGEHRHIGDEAMLAANLDRITSTWPAASTVVLGRASSEAEIRDAVARSDAALISGGGNLSDTWPDLVEQRLVALDEAAARGIPVAVVGQSIGPNLSGALRDRVGVALRTAAVVGVRDQSSAEIAEALGIPSDRVLAQVDDAFALPEQAPDDPRLRAVVERGALVVSLDEGWASDEGRVLLAPIATQIAAFARDADLEVLFLPHVQWPERPEEGDVATGTWLGRELGLQGVALTIAPTLGPAECAWLTRRAQALISTRYHALVFATSAGVPGVGLHADAYTAAKIVGALEQLGLQRWSLAITEAAAGALLPLLEHLHARQDDLRPALRARAEALLAADLERWQHVARTLAGAASPRPTSMPAATRADPPEQASRPFGSSTRGPREDDLARDLAAADWATFERSGFLPLGQVLGDAEISALTERADQLASGTVRNGAIRLQADSGGAYAELPEAVERLESASTPYRKIQGLEFDDRFIKLVRHPRLLEAAARVYGRHVPLSVFRAMVMNKPAGRGTHLPWHQDGGDVWQLDREPLVTIWIALDPATRANGCMECIPGSHHLGLLSAYGSTVSDEDARRHCPAELVHALEVPAGHAVLLHNWLIHRSGVNPSPIPRRAVTICYLDGRSRSLQTGRPYPLVSGYADPRPPRFVEQLEHDLRDRALAAEESARYAKSLEQARQVAEDYARSLEEERERLGR